MPNKPPKGPVKTTTLRDNLLSMFAPRIDAAMPSNSEQSPSSFDEYANLSNRYNPALFGDDELRRFHEIYYDYGAPRAPISTDMARNRYRDIGNSFGYSGKESDKQYNQMYSPEKQALRDSVYTSAMIKKAAGDDGRSPYPMEEQYRKAVYGRKR